ncbi:PTS sugar transporter subunit IIA [Pectinatus haikarae]|uniref:Fructose-specific phosphotransferase system IIA component n=1 Tax=Pectinatus haikarae TaxID=349096 RepID=A0ABT9YC58_9FIRM|nr:PTS sugar transporter subunit IIA [Pectinatus haikarae]MDQ0205213.1 fructose-specific phosphotransferase system IIA component [Pectinatus haikarae]
MGKVLISNALQKNAVVLNVDSFNDKEAVFDFLADRLEQVQVVKNKDDFVAALNYREKLGPTYMGNFIAIPHGKSKTVVNPGVAFCRCRKPFIYKSADTAGEVKYIFMLAIPESQAANDYLRVLAALAGMLVHQEFIDALETIESYEQLLLIIEKWQ